MNYSEFMTAVVEIYGSYAVNEKGESLLEKLTFKYVKERWEESLLEGIFKQLTLLKSTTWKDVKPPDPAEFEKLFPRSSGKTSLDVRAKMAYSDICRYSTMHPVLFSDLSAQAAVELMGGWSEFGKRNSDDEQIHRNMFCKYYKQFAEDPTELQPKILNGSGNWYKPKEPQLIGNREECLKIEADINSHKIKEIDSLAESFKI